MNETIGYSELDITATKRIARTAGYGYIVLSVLSIFGFLYVPSAIVVSRDAAATAANIASSELLFRAGIVSSLLAMIVYLFVAVTLYRLFRSVDRQHALFLLAIVTVSVAITMVNIFNRIAPLVLLSGADFLTVFERPQLEALAYAFLRFYGEASSVTDLLSGLWLFPFGILVARSGFIPKILGILLMIAGTGYLLAGLTSLLAPQYVAAVTQFTMPLIVGEFPIIFWLMIVGARRRPTGASATGLPPGG